MMKKLFALITTICFVFTSVLAPAAEGAVDVVQTARTAGECRAALEAPAAAFALNIPASIGRISGSKDLGSDRLVICVQDLHCHPEVQRNISKILSSIEEYAVKASSASLMQVYVEGGYGNIDTSWLTAINDKDARKQVMEALVDQGRLTGTEYYSITTGRYRLLKGLEDEKLHKANIVRLERLLEKKPRFETTLKELSDDLDYMKLRHFTGRNKRFNKILSKYRSGKMDAAHYYSCLGKYVEQINAHPQDYNALGRLSLENYPNIKAHKELLAMQKHLPYNRIASELQEFMQTLKAQLPYSAYRQLLERTDNLSKLDSFYAELPELAKTCHLELDRKYPALQVFVAYIEKNRSLNPVALVKEEKRLVEDLRVAFSKDTAELEVSFLSDFFSTFEDFLTTRLSSDDYDYYRSRIEKFKTIWGNYAFQNHVQDLAADMPLLEEYYAVNDQRNGIFLKNMEQAQAGVTVVVAGGFHTEGLTRLLEEQKISSLTITPNVTTDTRQSDTVYRAVAERQSKLFSSQALALALGSSSARVIRKTGNLIELELDGESLKLRKAGDKYVLPDGWQSTQQDVHPRRTREALETAVTEAVLIADKIQGLKNPLASSKLIYELVKYAALWGAEREMFGGDGLIWAIASNDKVQEIVEKEEQLTPEKLNRLSSYMQVLIKGHALQKDRLAKKRLKAIAKGDPLVAAIDVIPELQEYIDQPTSSAGKQQKTAVAYSIMDLQSYLAKENHRQNWSDDISELHQSIGWSDRDTFIRSVIGSSLNRSFVAVNDEGRIIGYVMFMPEKKVSQQTHIPYLAVHGDYQDKKIGINLIRTVIDAMKAEGRSELSFFYNSQRPEEADFYEKGLAKHFAVISPPGKDESRVKKIVYDISSEIIPAENEQPRTGSPDLFSDPGEKYLLTRPQPGNGMGEANRLLFNEIWELNRSVGLVLYNADAMQKLKNAENIVIVARNEKGTLLGYVIAEPERTLEGHEGVWVYLPYIVVSDDHRDKGIGTALVRAAAEELNKRNKSELALHYHTLRQEAQFYKSLEKYYEVRLKMPDGQYKIDNEPSTFIVYKINGQKGTAGPQSSSHSDKGKSAGTGEYSLVHLNDTESREVLLDRLKDDIEDLHRSVGMSYLNETIIFFLQDKNTNFDNVVAVDGSGKIVGYTLVHIQKSEEADGMQRGSVPYMAVHGSFQGQRIAEQMIDAVFEKGSVSTLSFTYYANKQRRRLHEELKKKYHVLEESGDKDVHVVYGIAPKQVSSVPAEKASSSIKQSSHSDRGGPTLAATGSTIDNYLAAHGRRINEYYTAGGWRQWLAVAWIALSPELLGAMRAELDEMVKAVRALLADKNDTGLKKAFIRKHKIDPFTREELKGTAWDDREMALEEGFSFFVFSARLAQVLTLPFFLVGLKGIQDAAIIVAVALSHWFYNLTEIVTAIFTWISSGGLIPPSPQYAMTTEGSGNSEKQGQENTEGEYRITNLDVQSDKKLIERYLAANVAEIHASLGWNDERTAQAVAMMRDAANISVVARNKEGKIIGYSIVIPAGDVPFIAVAGGHQQQGVALLMLGSVIKEMRKKGMHRLSLRYDPDDVSAEYAASLKGYYPEIEEQRDEDSGSSITYDIGQGGQVSAPTGGTPYTGVGDYAATVEYILQRLEQFEQTTSRVSRLEKYELDAIQEHFKTHTYDPARLRAIFDIYFNQADLEYRFLVPFLTNFTDRETQVLPEGNIFFKLFSSKMLRESQRLEDALLGRFNLLALNPTDESKNLYRDMLAYLGRKWDVANWSESKLDAHITLPDGRNDYLSFIIAEDMIDTAAVVFELVNGHPVQRKPLIAQALGEARIVGKENFKAVSTQLEEVLAEVKGKYRAAWRTMKKPVRGEYRIVHLLEINGKKELSGNMENDIEDLHQSIGWSERNHEVTQKLVKSEYSSFVAVDGEGKIIGYIMVEHDIARGEGRVPYLAVHDGYQRNRIAEQLVGAVIDELRENNIGALRFEYSTQEPQANFYDALKKQYRAQTVGFVFVSTLYDISRKKASDGTGKAKRSGGPGISLMTTEATLDNYLAGEADSKLKELYEAGGWRRWLVIAWVALSPESLGASRAELAPLEKAIRKEGRKAFIGEHRNDAFTGTRLGTIAWGFKWLALNIGYSFMWGTAQSVRAATWPLKFTRFAAVHTYAFKASIVITHWLYNLVAVTISSFLYGISISLVKLNLLMTTGGEKTHEVGQNRSSAVSRAETVPATNAAIADELLKRQIGKKNEHLRQRIREAMILLVDLGIFDGDHKNEARKFMKTVLAEDPDTALDTLLLLLRSGAVTATNFKEVDDLYGSIQLGDRFANTRDDAFEAIKAFIQANIITRDNLSDVRLLFDPFVDSFFDDEPAKYEHYYKALRLLAEKEIAGVENLKLLVVMFSEMMVNSVSTGPMTAKVIDLVNADLVNKENLFQLVMLFYIALLMRNEYGGITEFMPHFEEILKSPETYDLKKLFPGKKQYGGEWQRDTAMLNLRSKAVETIYHYGSTATTQEQKDAMIAFYGSTAGHAIWWFLYNLVDLEKVGRDVSWMQDYLTMAIHSGAASKDLLMYRGAFLDENDSAVWKDSSISAIRASLPVFTHIVYHVQRQRQGRGIDIPDEDEQNTMIFGMVRHLFDRRYDPVRLKAIFDVYFNADDDEARKNIESFQIGKGAGENAAAFYTSMDDASKKLHKEQKRKLDYRFFVPFLNNFVNERTELSPEAELFFRAFTTREMNDGSAGKALKVIMGDTLKKLDKNGKDKSAARFRDVMSLLTKKVDIKRDGSRKMAETILSFTALLLNLLSIQRREGAEEDPAYASRQKVFEALTEALAATGNDFESAYQTLENSIEDFKRAYVAESKESVWESFDELIKTHETRKEWMAQAAYAGTVIIDEAGTTLLDLMEGHKRGQRSEAELLSVIENVLKTDRTGRIRNWQEHSKGFMIVLEDYLAKKQLLSMAEYAGGIAVESSGKTLLDVMEEHELGLRTGKEVRAAIRKALDADKSERLKGWRGKSIKFRMLFQDYLHRKHRADLDAYVAKLPVDAAGKSLIDTLIEYLQGQRFRDETIEVVYRTLIAENTGRFGWWRYRSQDFTEMFREYLRPQKTLKAERDVSDRDEKKKVLKAKAEKAKRIRESWKRNRYYSITDKEGDTYYIGFTDLFPTMLNLGNVFRDYSCLATDQEQPEKSQGLMGYVANGSNKALVVYDENGNLVSRRLTRLKYTGNDEFIVMREKTYGDKQFNGAFDSLLNMVAHDMGVRYQPDKADTEEKVVLHLWGGHSVWDYSDTYGGIGGEKAGLIRLKPGKHTTVKVTIPLATATIEKMAESFKSVDELLFKQIAGKDNSDFARASPPAQVGLMATTVSTVDNYLAVHGKLVNGLYNAGGWRRWLAVAWIALSPELLGAARAESGVIASAIREGGRKEFIGGHRNDVYTRTELGTIAWGFKWLALNIGYSFMWGTAQSVRAATWPLKFTRFAAVRVYAFKSSIVITHWLYNVVAVTVSSVLYALSISVVKLNLLMTVSGDTTKERAIDDGVNIENTSLYALENTAALDEKILPLARKSIRVLKEDNDEIQLKYHAIALGKLKKMGLIDDEFRLTEDDVARIARLAKGRHYNEAYRDAYLDIFDVVMEYQLVNRVVVPDDVIKELIGDGTNINKTSYYILVRFLEKGFIAKESINALNLKDTFRNLLNGRQNNHEWYLIYLKGMLLLQKEAKKENILDGDGDDSRPDDEVFAEIFSIDPYLSNRDAVRLINQKLEKLMVLVEYGFITRDRLLEVGYIEKLHKFMPYQQQLPLLARFVEQLGVKGLMEKDEFKELNMTEQLVSGLVSPTAQVRLDTARQLVTLKKAGLVTGITIAAANLKELATGEALSKDLFGYPDAWELKRTWHALRTLVENDLAELNYGQLMIGRSGVIALALKSIRMNSPMAIEAAELLRKLKANGYIAFDQHKGTVRYLSALPEGYYDDILYYSPESILEELKKEILNPERKEKRAYAAEVLQTASDIGLIDAGKATFSTGEIDGILNWKESNDIRLGYGAEVDMIVALQDNLQLLPDAAISRLYRKIDHLPEINDKETAVKVRKIVEAATAINGGIPIDKSFTMLHRLVMLFEAAVSTERDTLRPVVYAIDYLAERGSVLANAFAGKPQGKVAVLRDEDVANDIMNRVTQRVGGTQSPLFMVTREVVEKLVEMKIFNTDTADDAVGFIRIVTETEDEISMETLVKMIRKGVITPDNFGQVRELYTAIQSYEYHRSRSEVFAVLQKYVDKDIITGNNYPGIIKLFVPEKYSNDPQWRSRNDYDYFKVLDVFADKGVIKADNLDFAAVLLVDLLDGEWYSYGRAVSGRFAGLAQKDLINHENLYLLAPLYYVATLQKSNYVVGSIEGDGFEAVLRAPQSFESYIKLSGDDDEIAAAGAALFKRSMKITEYGNKLEMLKLFMNRELKNSLRSQYHELWSKYNDPQDRLLLTAYLEPFLDMGPAAEILLSRAGLFVESFHSHAVDIERMQAYLKTVAYIFFQMRKSMASEEKNDVQMNEMQTVLMDTIADHLLSHYYDPDRLKAIFDIYFNSLDKTAQKNIDAFEITETGKNRAAFYRSMERVYRKMHREQKYKLDYFFLVPFLKNYVDGETQTMQETEMFFKLFTSRKLNRTINHRILKTVMRDKLNLFDVTNSENTKLLLRKIVRLVDKNSTLKSMPADQAAEDLITMTEVVKNIISLQGKASAKIRNYALEWSLRVRAGINESIQVPEGDGKNYLSRYNELKKSILNFNYFYNNGKPGILLNRLSSLLGEDMAREDAEAVITYASRLRPNEDGRTLLDFILDYIQAQSLRKEVLYTVRNALINEAKGLFHEWRYRSNEYIKMFKAYGEEKGKDIDKIWRDNRYYTYKDSRGKKYHVAFTDDLSVLVKLGHLKNQYSCQRTNEPSYNHGLAGYVANGSNKALVVYDENGTLIARQVVRLRYTDKDEFVLLHERTYGERLFTGVMGDLLGNIAYDMGIRYMSDSNEPGQEINIRLWGGHSEWDYSDLYGHKRNGAGEDHGLIRMASGAEALVSVKVPLKKSSKAVLNENEYSKEDERNFKDLVNSMAFSEAAAGSYNSFAVPAEEIFVLDGDVFFRGVPVKISEDTAKLERIYYDSRYGSIYIDDDGNPYRESTDPIEQGGDRRISRSAAMSYSTFDNFLDTHKWMKAVYDLGAKGGWWRWPRTMIVAWVVLSIEKQGTVRSENKRIFGTFRAEAKRNEFIEDHRRDPYTGELLDENSEAWQIKKAALERFLDAAQQAAERARSTFSPLALYGMPWMQEVAIQTAVGLVHWFNNLSATVNIHFPRIAQWLPVNTGASMAMTTGGSDEDDLYTTIQNTVDMKITDPSLIPDVKEALRLLFEAKIYTKRNYLSAGSFIRVALMDEPRDSLDSVLMLLRAGVVTSTNVDRLYELYYTIHSMPDPLYEIGRHDAIETLKTFTSEGIITRDNMSSIKLLFSPDSYAEYPADASTRPEDLYYFSALKAMAERKVLTAENLDLAAALFIDILDSDKYTQAKMNEVMKRVKEMTDKGVLHSGNLFLLTTLLYIETLKDRDDPTRMSMNADLETLLREPSPAHYEQWWGGTDREGLRIIAALLYEKSRAAATPSQQDQLKKFYEDPEAREKLSGSRASLLNDFSGLGDPSLLNDFVALALKLDPSQNSLFSRYDVFMKSARDAKTTPAAIRAYMEAVSYIFSQVQLVRQQKSEVENMASSTNGEILQYLLSHFFAAAPLKAVFDVYFNPLNDSARREIERYDLRADKPDPAAFYESLADGYLDMHKRHNRKLDHIFFVPFMEYFVTDDSRVLPEGELFFRIFTLKMLRDKRSIKERLRRKIDALDTYPEEMRIPLFRKLLGLLERQWDVAEKKDNELEKKSIGGKYAAMSIAVDIVRGSELIAKLAAPAYRGRLLSATEELALKTAVQEKIDEAAAADGQEFDAKQKELEKALQMFDRFQEKKLIADLRKRFKAILGRTMSRSIFDALILYAAKFTRQVDQYNFYEVLMEYVENIKGNKEAVKTIYQALIKEIRGKYKDWRYRSPEYLKMFEQYRAFAGKMKWRRKDTKAKIEKIKKNWENNRQYEFTGQDGKKYYMGFTDNLPVLMNLGNPAEFDSCLATYRKNNSYTAGLGGYVANGGNKAMVVFDEDGQFVSRRVVRLRYTRADEFVLLSEKRYGSGTFDEPLEQLLGSVARDMGVRYQTYKEEEGKMTDLDINLWGGHSIWDYSDLYGNQQQRENAGFLTIYPGQHFTVNIKVPLKTAGTASLKEDYKGISENSFLKVAINRDDFQSPGVSAAQATVSLSRHSAARDGTKDAGETGEYRIERLNYAEASPAQKEKIDHELYKIHESIDWTFRHEAVMELMEDPRFIIYVAKNADDEIIGYHMYEIVKGEDPEEPLIGRGQFLAVLKRYHKEKIGKALVLKGIQELQKMKIKRWYYNYDPLRPKEFHETMKKHLPFVEEKDQRFMRLTYTIAGVKTGQPQTGDQRTYPSSRAAVIAAFDLLKEVLDDIENVSVQTARAVKSLLADMASGRGGAGTLLDWHYLESGDLAEAIDTFGTVIEDSNGDMHAGMYILGRRTAAMDAWEWEPTGIRVDENMVWASTKAGAVVLYADNVQPERIAAAVNGELLMKGRLAGSRKGVERFKTLIGEVAGNRIDLEGTAFKPGIVVDHRTQDKKRAYSASGNPVVSAGYFAADGRPEQETIAARYGELMHERHTDAVAMAQSFFVRLDGIRSIEEFKANLDAFLLTGNVQMIADPAVFAGVSDRVVREITGLAASSGVKIYIELKDSDPETLARYQGKGFAGYALTGDGTVTVYDYLSNTAGIEADTVQGYTDPAGLNDKLQASRRPYKVLNLSELKNLMEGGQRDILDRVALTEMLKTTILSFYNGPTLTPEYVQRAGEAWDRDRLPPLSDDLTALKKAAISGKPDELIAAMGIKDIEHPVKRYLDKLDVEDRDTAVQLQQAYLTAITGRMLARAVLDAAEKRQGLADPELEIILGRKLVQQLRQNTADAGIDESFLQVEKAKDSDTTVKFYERLKDTVRALNSRTNDPKAINTIIQLIPLHAEQRMSIRIEQPQTNFDTKAINKLLSAA